MAIICSSDTFATKPTCTQEYPYAESYVNYNYNLVNIVVSDKIDSTHILQTEYTCETKYPLKDSNCCIQIEHAHHHMILIMAYYSDTTYLISYDATTKIVSHTEIIIPIKYITMYTVITEINKNTLYLKSYKSYLLLIREKDVWTYLDITQILKTYMKNDISIIYDDYDKDNLYMNINEHIGDTINWCIVFSISKKIITFKNKINIPKTEITEADIYSELPPYMNGYYIVSNKGIAICMYDKKCRMCELPKCQITKILKINKHFIMYACNEYAKYIVFNRINNRMYIIPINSCNAFMNVKLISFYDGQIKFKHFVQPFDNNIKTYYSGETVIAYFPHIIYIRMINRIKDELAALFSQ